MQDWSSGPVATRVISPGDPSAFARMKSTACRSIGPTGGVGAGGLNFFSRSPNRATSRFSKWTGASMSAFALPTIGRQAPAATGMSCRPASAKVLRTTFVTCSIAPAAPTDGRDAFELDGGGNRREQNRKNVVASGINVENDAFHLSPSTRPGRPPRSWIEMLRLAPSSPRSPGSGAVVRGTKGRRGRPRPRDRGPRGRGRTIRRMSEGEAIERPRIRREDSPKGSLVDRRSRR